MVFLLLLVLKEAQCFSREWATCHCGDACFVGGRPPNSEPAVAGARTSSNVWSK